MLFLGHNFRTTNARKSAKGSKDSDFRQFRLQRQNYPPLVIF